MKKGERERERESTQEVMNIITTRDSASFCLFFKYFFFIHLLFFAVAAVADDSLFSLFLALTTEFNRTTGNRQLLPFPAGIIHNSNTHTRGHTKKMHCPDARLLLIFRACVQKKKKKKNKKERNKQ